VYTHTYIYIYIYISDAISIGWQPRVQLFTWRLLALIGGTGSDQFTVQAGGYHNVWHPIRKTIQEEGIEAFYQGLPPTIIGLVPYCAAASYFVYDNLISSLFKQKPAGQCSDTGIWSFHKVQAISSLSLSLSLTEKCRRTTLSSCNAWAYEWGIVASDFSK
jgi:hypothetical protein